MAEIHNGKESWKTSIASARTHIDEAFRELAHAAEQAKSQGKEAWETAQSKAREAWDDIRERGSAALGDGREKSEEWATEGRHYVRKNPAKAVAISALTGLVLGILLAASSSSDEA
jgi:ElaB/YqjD/DUF883 family membrane-anchored ribosome-binding protein